MSKLKRRIGEIYWRFARQLKVIRIQSREYWRSVGQWLNGWNCSENDNSQGMETAHSVVVCAHPDDETIFFSSILKGKKPFVICASHRGNKIRSHEFHEALRCWNVNGIMLNFPDVKGMTWIWKIGISVSLRNMKKRLPHVQTVYTHSGSGESGHPHHFAVNGGVRKVFSDCKIFTTARSLPDDNAEHLIKAHQEEKEYIIRKCYPSQIKMLETWCWWWKPYLCTEYFEE